MDYVFCRKVVFIFKNVYEGIVVDDVDREYFIMFLGWVFSALILSFLGFGDVII